MALNFNYNETMEPGIAGTIADTGPNELISRTVETAAGVGFGVPVQQGDNDNGCKVMAAGATNCVGITVLDRTTAPSETKPDMFLQYDSARLMRKGSLWVVASGAVSPEDPVWVDLSDGSFSNADAGTSGSIRLAGSRWTTTAADGGVAKIRFNLDVDVVAGAA